MYVLGRMLKKSDFLKAVGNAVVRKRGHVYATPPRKKISAAEKAVYFVALSASCWTFPFWVLYHVKEYQGTDK